MPREDTQWKKGQSGNPKGRKTKRDWMKQVIGGRENELLSKALTLALAGKQRMIELLLTRCLPPASQDEEVKGLKMSDKSHSERGEEVIKALEDGRITPSQAHTIFASLERNVKLVEATDVIERIKRIEEAMRLK